MRLGDYHALHLCRLDGLNGAGVGDMDSTARRSELFALDIKLFTCRIPHSYRDYQQVNLKIRASQSLESYSRRMTKIEFWTVLDVNTYTEGRQKSLTFHTSITIP